MQTIGLTYVLLGAAQYLGTAFLLRHELCISGLGCLWYVFNAAWPTTLFVVGMRCIHDHHPPLFISAPPPTWSSSRRTCNRGVWKSSRRCDAESSIANASVETSRALDEHARDVAARSLARVKSASQTFLCTVVRAVAFAAAPSPTGDPRGDLRDLLIDERYDPIRGRVRPGRHQLPGVGDEPPNLLFERAFLRQRRRRHRSPRLSRGRRGDAAGDAFADVVFSSVSSAAASFAASINSAAAAAAFAPPLPPRNPPRWRRAP